MTNPRRTHGVTVNYLDQEVRVPQNHPLRALKRIVAETLDELAHELRAAFASSDVHSISPEKILRLQLLQALYSIRTEKLMLEQLEYNLLFRWFVGMAMEDPPWDGQVVTRARENLGGTELSRRFFSLVSRRADGAGLLADEHFAVDTGALEERVKA
jgi:transposase